MSAPRDESANDFSLLQKQLILSQVQILELEDLRDELQTALAAKTQILTELQTLADRTFEEIELSRSAQTAATEALRQAREACDALQGRVQLLEAATVEQAQQLTQRQLALEAAQAETAKQVARTASLEGDLRALRASRSWRWTAPLRSVARLFG